MSYTSQTAFFYGTLMAPEVVSRVLFGAKDDSQMSRLNIKPALLNDYRRHRVIGCDYPAIVAHSSSTVRGSYVTGLKPSDIMRLDIFEGDQYTREKVMVKVFKQTAEAGDVVAGEVNDDVEGELMGAQVYVWKDVHEHLEEQEWDFEHFRKEKMSRWMGESRDSEQDWEEVDSGFADVDNAAESDMAGKDATGGRGANGHITEQLKSQTP